ncbi:uncharacterized protein LOC117186934 isoform X2 [Drosophila miranda]|uniref:uncharacterized protein LOC117186934 isoform X2 n=1 Tax=Drosophila miranda TaxID=7229 RepID=UPI00143FA197|nr:uncharacterized protein LOC117186934 isoform X2 [Drosophila miranda]
MFHQGSKVCADSRATSMDYLPGVQSNQRESLSKAASCTVEDGEERGNNRQYCSEPIRVGTYDFECDMTLCSDFHQAVQKCLMVNDEGKQPMPKKPFSNH